MCLYTLGKLPWVKADEIAFGLGGGLLSGSVSNSRNRP